MSYTFTDLLHLAMPARGDKNWDADVSRVFRTIDKALQELGGRPQFFDKRVVVPGAVSVNGRDVTITGIEAVPDQTKVILDGGTVSVPGNTSRKPRIDSLSINPSAPDTIVLTQGNPAAFSEMFRVASVFDKNNTNLGDIIPAGGVAPVVGLFEDSINERLVAMVLAQNDFSGPPAPPLLYVFDPDTGQFTDLNVTFRVTAQFQQDVGPLSMVLPLGCIAPNDAGTDISYLFVSILGLENHPLGVCLCEFDSTGLLINMMGFANMDGNLFPALPFNMRYTGRGGSNQRRFEVNLWPLSMLIRMAKPFLATVEMGSPPSNLKMLGQDITFGSVTARAVEIDIGSVKCLDEYGNRLVMPGGGLSESGYCVAGAFRWDGQLHSLMSERRDEAPWNSVQGEMDRRTGFNPLVIIPEIYRNTCLWDWNATSVSPALASPVTPSNTEQLAMSNPVNNSRIYFSNVQFDSARLIINSGNIGGGYKAPPVGKSIVIHIKTEDGIDCYWECTLEDFGNSEIGVTLNDAHVFRGNPPSDYNQLNWDSDRREVRIGIRTNNSNNYDERAFNLAGVHDSDIGKPILGVYDDGIDRFEFISYICDAGEKRKVYAGTDQLGDDWLGPIYRETNRGDIHIGWNVLDSSNVESWPESTTFTPVVQQQETDFITILQHSGRPSSSDQVTYSKDGATGTWLDPNAGTNGDTYRLDDMTLVSSVGLPQKSGGGTDYGTLDPNCFSCTFGSPYHMLTIDVLTDPSKLSVYLIPYIEPLIENTGLDVPSIIGVSAGITRFGGRYYAVGLTFAGIPGGAIMEFTPFEKLVAPDVPANHIKIAEVLVPPDEEAPDVSVDNVRTAPDYSEATVSRSNQFLAFLFASSLNNDFKNLSTIVTDFVPIFANMK